MAREQLNPVEAQARYKVGKGTEVFRRIATNVLSTRPFLPTDIYSYPEVGLEGLTERNSLEVIDELYAEGRGAVLVSRHSSLDDPIRTLAAACKASKSLAKMKFVSPFEYHIAQKLRLVTKYLGPVTQIETYPLVNGDTLKKHGTTLDDDPETVVYRAKNGEILKKGHGGRQYIFAARNAVLGRGGVYLPIDAGRRSSIDHQAEGLKPLELLDLAIRKEQAHKVMLVFVNYELAGEDTSEISDGFNFGKPASLVLGPVLRLEDARVMKTDLGVSIDTIARACLTKNAMCLQTGQAGEPQLSEMQTS